MKILVGKIITNICGNKTPIYAIELPGLGILESRPQKDDFDLIELNKEQLLLLKEEIEKELAHD